MSIEAVAAALYHSKASTSARLVLVTIAHFEGEQGAWPSQATLSKMTGLSERSVRRAIAELAALFELDVVADDGAGYGARKTNRYFIILECPEGCDNTVNHRKPTAEIVSLAAIRQKQYRSKNAPIEVKNGTNRGHP